MGQAILYCFRCSTQLREGHFEKGKAFRIDSWVTCSECAPDLVKSLPPDRGQALQDLIAGKGRKASSGAIPALREPRRTTPIPFPAAKDEAGRRPPIALIAGGVAVLVAIAIGAVVLSGGRTAPPAALEEETSAPRRGSTRPAPSADPGRPADSPERRALERARAFAKDHPDDLEGQLREFSDLALLADRTEIGAEARKAVDGLQIRERDAVSRSMTALNGELDPMLQREDFAAARQALAAARLRLPGTQWPLALEKKQRDVEDRLDTACRALQEKARAAKVAGNAAEVDAALEKARRWGDGPLAAVTQAVAGVAPPPPPPPEAPTRTPEAKSYLARWEQAMAKAAARDYAGAAAELEPTAPAWKEEAVRQELAQDVRDLKDLDRLVQAALAAPAISKVLNVTTLDGRSLAGRLLWADGDRLELVVEPGKTTFVEWADVDAATIVALSASPDVRLTAILALVDGNPGAYRPGIDPKYAAFAAIARSKVPPPSADELRAREVYYDAERQFRSMATREKAVEAYRLLRQKFKDTALVRRAAARLERRSESGKEYYFLGPDLAAGGTFSPTKDGRFESLADVDPARPNPNWVEAEFLALPSTAYRCWMLVGGCCAEHFTLHYQATGLTELNPRTKKRGPAEPGGDLASPLKHALKNLKPSHPKGEPPKPTRWEWLELPLPRTTAGGVRKVRLLTDLQGVGVAAVLVSSSKSKPPTEAEAAELVKARALDAVPAWFGAKSVGVPRLALDEFDQGVAGWSYHGGYEFPGAKGSMTHDASVGHDRKGALHLSADFSVGGAYVSVGRSLPPGVDAKEVRFWLRSDGAVEVGVRVGDSSDQVLQKPVTLGPSAEWRQVVLTFEKWAGAEHWGGAKDGQLHGPVKNFHLCFSVRGFGGAKTGDVWIDDVEALLQSDPPDPGK